MKTRVLTALVMAVVGIPLLIFSQYIIYPIAAAAMSVIALYEMSALTGMRKRLAVMIPAYLIAAAMPIVSYFFADRLANLTVAIGMTAFGYMLYTFGYAVIMRGAVRFADVAAHFTTFAYISVSFTTLILVRYIPEGVYYFALVYVASWVCDIFAYFVGRAIGKHKLIPEISPKKTVEGAIGGVFFTTVSFLVYGLVIDFTTSAVTPNYIVLAILGFVLSIIAQFGDLIASLIKREHGIKDYGVVFPGHGGVLDRFDSILAVAPVLFAICTFFPPFA